MWTVLLAVAPKTSRLGAFSAAPSGGPSLAPRGMFVWRRTYLMGQASVPRLRVAALARLGVTPCNCRRRESAAARSRALPIAEAVRDDCTLARQNEQLGGRPLPRTVPRSFFPSLLRPSRGWYCSAPWIVSSGGGGRSVLQVALAAAAPDAALARAHRSAFMA